MKTLTTIGCALVMLVTGGVAWAVAQDAKAAEVLAKTREALGAASIERMKTLSVEASMQRNVGQMQISSDVEMLLEMPDKFVRSETSRGGMNMTMSTGFNGDTAILPAGARMTAPGAMVIRMGPGGPIQGDAPKLTDEQKAQMNAASLRAARSELSRMMLGWFGMAHPTLKAQYTYAGEAESPDGKAHVIDVKDGDGFEARLFIDQNNHLPLMVTYKGRQPRMMTSRMPAGGSGAPQGSAQARQLTDEERKKLQEETEARIKQELADQPLVEFALFFDDWREVDGILFPHLMRRGAGGETNEEWTINKVRVNPKIDARKFDVSR
ncbi:MAG TPA: hypothetical protein VGD94_13975 [Vicinamibacterales bacterium]